MKEVPLITTHLGEKLTCPYKIAEFICKLTGANHVLLGRSDEELESHKNFFEQLNNEHNIFVYLNEKLKYDSFINGFNNITISDLYAFGMTLVALKQFSDKDKFTYSNLVRWALHIQSLSGIKEQISRLNLKITPPFDKLFINMNFSETTNLKDTNNSTINKTKGKESKVDDKNNKEIKEDKKPKDVNPEKQKEIEKKIELARLEKEAKKKEKVNEPKTNTTNNTEDPNKKDANKSKLLI